MMERITQEDCIYCHSADEYGLCADIAENVYIYKDDVDDEYLLCYKAPDVVKYFKINFCPMCGRDLGKAAYEDLGTVEEIREKLAAGEKDYTDSELWEARKALVEFQKCGIDIGNAKAIYEKGWHDALKGVNEAMEKHVLNLSKDSPKNDEAERKG